MAPAAGAPSPAAAAEALYDAILAAVLAACLDHNRKVSAGKALVFHNRRCSHRVVLQCMGAGVPDKMRCSICNLLRISLVLCWQSC